MPNGTTGRRCCAHSLTIAATSSVDVGKDHGVGKSRRVPRLAMAVVLADGFRRRDAVAEEFTISHRRSSSDRSTDGMLTIANRASAINDHVDRRSPIASRHRSHPICNPCLRRRLCHSSVRSNATTSASGFTSGAISTRLHCRGPMIAIVERLADDLPVVRARAGRRSESVAVPAVPRHAIQRRQDAAEDAHRRDVSQSHARPHERRGLVFRSRAGLGVDRRRPVARPTRRSCSWCASTSPPTIAGSTASSSRRAFRKIGGLQGDTMTRVPRGFAKDHPAAAT